MNNKLTRIIQALEGLKLTDIRIFDFRDYSPFFDFQILASGSNERQVSASVRHMIDCLDKDENLKLEGADEGRWILFDLGDIIVNVMHKEEREYYQLEKLFIQRKEIPVMEISNGI